MHSRLVEAPIQVVWDALSGLTLNDLPAARLLMRLRSGGRKRPTQVAPLLTHGPIPARVLQPPRYAVGFKAHRPWARTDGPPVSLDNDVSVPTGWIVTGTDFLLEPEGVGTRLTTTTRCQATDTSSRRAMKLYWAAIGYSSGIVRREMLRGVCRKAPGATGTTSPGMGA